MKLPIYQVDAFANRLFAGNPAAVIPLDNFLPDEILLAIAAENNLSETAFLVRAGEEYTLRWFTPGEEVPLCGHATLASAAVVMERLDTGRSEVLFHTASGPLEVHRTAPGHVASGYVMDLPSNPCTRIGIPAETSRALGARPLEVWKNDRFLLVLLDDAATVRGLTPRMEQLSALDPHGVIVTAPGDGDYDFVSRFFAPALGVPEDPVTGSAHCVLAPFWLPRLGRTEFRAFQASRRGGEVVCRLRGERVELEGQTVFYLEGVVEI